MKLISRTICILLTIILLTFCIASCSTKKSISSLDYELTPNDIIGTWEFKKAVDKSNNEVSYFKQDYLGPDGKELKVKARGPKWIMNADRTYKLEFDKEHSDIGIWQFVDKNKIKFTMTISPESEQGKMISKTQKLLNKKWETDKKGNYLDSTVKEIIVFGKKEMWVDWRNKYTLIYIQK